MPLGIIKYLQREPKKLEQDVEPLEVEEETTSYSPIALPLCHLLQCYSATEAQEATKAIDLEHNCALL